MRKCSVEGCDGKHLARGMCRAHYLRMYKRGTLELERHKDRKCSVDGCENKHAAKGLCATHYSKIRDSGTLENLRYFGGPCESCGEPSKNGKYIKHKCYSCYRKAKMAEKKSFYNCVVKDRNRRRGGGDFETNLEEIAEKTSGLCHICGEEVDFNCSDNKMASIDHVIPLSKGGTNEASNLLLAHLSCNIRKSNK